MSEPIPLPKEEERFFLGAAEYIGEPAQDKETCTCVVQPTFCGTRTILCGRPTCRRSQSRVVNGKLAMVVEQCTAPDWDAGGTCGNPMPCADHAARPAVAPAPPYLRAPVDQPAIDLVRDFVLAGPHDGHCNGGYPNTPCVSSCSRLRALEVLDQRIVASSPPNQELFDEPRCPAVHRSEARCDLAPHETGRHAAENAAEGGATLVWTEVFSDEVAPS